MSKMQDLINNTRNKNGVSLHEAKLVIERELSIKKISNSSLDDDVKDVMTNLLRQVYPAAPSVIIRNEDLEGL